MTKSVWMVGAAIAIAAPAQAGGLLGGMGTANHNRSATAQSANGHGGQSVADRGVGIKANARVRAGIAAGEVACSISNPSLLSSSRRATSTSG